MNKLFSNFSVLRKYFMIRLKIKYLKKFKTYILGLKKMRLRFRSFNFYPPFKKKKLADLIYYRIEIIIRSKIKNITKRI